MSLTFAAANDEILLKLKTAWDATGYDMFWEAVPEDKTADENPWAVSILRHIGGGQASLKSSYGTMRFSRFGMLTVKINCPIGKGLQEAYQLAKVVVDAFEGVSTPGGVWFRNVRVNEGGRDGQYV